MKCGMPGDSGRVFDLRDHEAIESKCREKCSATPECIAYSGIFGQWCIGCNRPPDEEHTGAKAFKIQAFKVVADPGNDNMKCGVPGDSGRVFSLSLNDATESKCRAKCSRIPECVAYSGIFG